MCDDPCVSGMDELARKGREISPDSQLAVEKHSLRINLRHGPPIMGCSQRHRNNTKSFVSPSRILQSSLTRYSFQEVQRLCAIQAALRFLPNVIIGIVLNLATGLLVHRLHANHLVLVTTVLSAGSPLLMAIIDPKWSWWYCAFWAVLLGPLSADGKTVLQQRHRNKLTYE